MSVPLRSSSLLPKLVGVDADPDIPVTLRVNVVRPTLATQLPPTTCIPVALLARWWLMVLSVSVSTPAAVPKHWKLTPL